MILKLNKILYLQNYSRVYKVKIREITTFGVECEVLDVTNNPIYFFPFKTILSIRQPEDQF